MNAQSQRESVLAKAKPRLSEDLPDSRKTHNQGGSFVLRGTQTPPTLQGKLGISLGPLAAVKTACECAEPERVPCQKPRLSEEQPDLVRRKVKGLSLVLRGTETPPSLSGSLRGAQTDKRLGVPLGYSNGHSSPTSHTPGLGWESPTSSTPYWP